MAKIIKVGKSENGNSYQIDFGNGIVLWFDTWRGDDGELTGDWNKYIFYTNDDKDMKERAFQDAHDDSGAYNFMTALELSEEYEFILHRLEYLREQIEKECISYVEIAELQDLKEFISPDDVQLLQWAGVPENNNQ